MGTGRMLAGLALVALGGCHVVLPLAAAHDAGAKDSSVAVDQDVQVLSDLPPTDLSPADADLGDGPPPDQGQPGLSCSSPLLVGPPTTHGLVEPAMRGDRMTLTARRDGTLNWYCSTRQTPGGTDFGPWGSCMPSFAWEDPTFFVRNGAEQLIVAYRPLSPGPRALQLCDTNATCGPLTFTGLPTAVDIDGPDLPDPLLGVEELFFAGTSGGKSDLYRASGVFGKPFPATAMTNLNTAAYNEDDPAVSPDGFVLIFSSDRPGGLYGGANDLWLATWAFNAYSVNPLLNGLFQGVINSLADEAGPDLVEVTVGATSTLELYFHSDRDTPGVYAIYRAACSIQ